MGLFRHEFKKIAQSPALIGFAALCLLFNMFIVLIDGGSNEYANYVARVSRETGFRLGADFDERANNLEPSEHAALLRLQTYGMTDVFDGYTTGYIAEVYIAQLGLSGMVADLTSGKYARLQYAVDARFEAGDGMTLYLAGATFWRHEMLFSVVMGALLFQGMLLAALIMLLSLGYEHSAKTEFVVYATKTGRRVNRSKFIAGVVAGLSAYAIIAAVTLVVYLTLNPMGGSWGSSVSSGFNFVRCMLGPRPFVTWHGFTVLTYLLAALGVSAGIVLCFALMAYIAGLWIRNSYIAFLILALINFAVITLPGIVFGATMPAFILALSPIWLSLQQGMWFTDGGSNILWAHFETIGVVVSLLLLSVLCVWSSARFRGRDLL